MTRRQGYEKLLDLIKDGHILHDTSHDMSPRDETSVARASEDAPRSLMVSTQIALLLAATINKNKGTSKMIYCSVITILVCRIIHFCCDLSDR